MAKLIKHPRHSHHWVENGELYESYETIRGARYMFIMEVPGFPDKEVLTESDVEAIEKEFQ